MLLELLEGVSLHDFISMHINGLISNKECRNIIKVFHHFYIFLVNIKRCRSYAFERNNASRFKTLEYYVQREK